MNTLIYLLLTILGPEDIPCGSELGLAYHDTEVTGFIYVPHMYFYNCNVHDMTIHCQDVTFDSLTVVGENVDIITYDCQN